MTSSDRWPELAGRLVPGGGHILPVRVYFEDTDFSGVVYHGGYIRFMERGRSDFLRLLGVGHQALDRGDHGESLAFAVHKLVVEFLKPARIDEVLEIETRVKAIGGARIVLSQAVTRPPGCAGYRRGDGGDDQCCRTGAALAAGSARCARRPRHSLTVG